AEALVAFEVAHVADAGSADPLPAELDVWVTVEPDLAADVDRCVRSPCGNQHAPHGFARPPRPRELRKVDLHRLFGAPTAHLGDGECPGPGQQVYRVELVTSRGDGLADVHFRSPHPCRKWSARSS